MSAWRGRVAIGAAVLLVGAVPVHAESPQVEEPPAPTEEEEPVEVTEEVTEEGTEEGTEESTEEGAEEGTDGTTDEELVDGTTEKEEVGRTGEDGDAVELGRESAEADDVSELDDVALLLEELSARARPDAEAGEKIAAVRVLAGVEDERALALILQVAGSVDPPLLYSTSVRASFVRAVAEHVRRRDSLTSLELTAREASPAVLPLVADAVVETDAVDGVSFLTGLLGRTEELDRTALIGIETVARRRFDVQADEVERSVVRRHLTSPTVDVQRAAAAAVAELDDVAALPTLIGLLGHTDPRLVNAVAVALARLGGVDLGRDAALWEEWHAAELLWWQELAPSELEALAGDDPAAAHKALAAVAQHPLFRDELADAVGRLVRHADGPFGTAACEVLGRLGSRRAVPYLLDAVLSEDAARRESAARGLRALTGRDPATDDFVAWSEALGL